MPEEVFQRVDTLNWLDSEMRRMYAAVILTLLYLRHFSNLIFVYHANLVIRDVNYTYFKIPI